MSNVIVLIRHLTAILVLPFVVTVVVPRWLMRTRSPAVTVVPLQLSATPSISMAATVLGGATLLLGAALFAWCVVLFARVGRGTLAPWDPTRRLVAVGPYRYMRNPMITGVAGVLAGESLIFLSPRLGAWLLLFLAINQVYFVLVEEPGLERRFGESFRAYRAIVPRWLPRSSPWREGTGG